MQLLRAIGKRLLIVAAVAAVAGGAYLAQGAVGGTVATYYQIGNLDLLVDSRGFYNGVVQPKLTWAAKDLKPHVDKFFRFKDIKPGDSGKTIISLHIKKESAWACLVFDEWEEKENGRNEPEKEADGTWNKAELATSTEFFAWFDDGDNTFEVGEKPLFGTSSQSAVKTVKNKTYALADYKNGPAWPKNSVKYVGIAWCAGNLTVNLAAAAIACDGSTMGNEAQTDSFTFDVTIEALPSKQDAKFVCGKKSGGHGGYDHYEWDNDYTWYDWGHDGHGGSCRTSKRW